MNPPRSLRAALSAALVIVALATLVPASAKEVVLVDFGESRKDPDGTMIRVYEYTFQAWGGGKVHDVRGRGALVRAASGSGGLGENRTAVKFDKSPALEITYIIGNGNAATSITFALTDKDGTEAQWNVPLAGRPVGAPLHHRIDLQKPDSTQKPGKTPGLDLKRIGTWQVRGNYSPPPVEVMLVRICAVD